MRRCGGGGGGDAIRNLQETSADLQNLSQTLINPSPPAVPGATASRPRQQQSQQQKLTQQRTQAEAQLQQSQQELATTQSRPAELAETLPTFDQQITAKRQAPGRARAIPKPTSEWQTAQAAVQELEDQLNQRQKPPGVQTAERELQ